MSKIIEDLNWRYATKKYDSNKIIKQADLDVLKEVLRLTPTSYGLQPIKFLIIKNKSVRLALKEKSYGQTQITEASHLLILCANLDVTDQHVDELIHNTAETRELDKKDLQGYADFMKSTIGLMTRDSKKSWNIKQTYIALGLLLQSCAQLRIDATPMEGFDNKAYDEILGLSKKNLTAVVACPIGYRHDSDVTQHAKKVRKSEQDIFEEIE
jgi:nitroreductase